MKPDRPEIHPNAKVWRISEDAPMGAWVDKKPSVNTAKSRGLPEIANNSWMTSSHDLLDGSHASEVPPDTMSSDLFNELFVTAPSDGESGAENAK